MKVLLLLSSIGRLIFACYFLYHFLVGDKSKMETMWYGLATLLFIV